MKVARQGGGCAGLVGSVLCTLGAHVRSRGGVWSVLCVLRRQLQLPPPPPAAHAGWQAQALRLR